MTFRSWLNTACVVCGLLSFALPAFAQDLTVYERLDAITRELQQARTSARDNRLADARGAVLRAYLDHYELVEGFYGAGGKYAIPSVAQEVAEGEVAFHALMRSADAQALERAAVEVDERIAAIKVAMQAGNVVATPAADAANVVARDVVAPASASTSEIRGILTELESAARAYQAGDAARALGGVEHAYLEGFEPIESRLPSNIVDGIEKLIHLQLRPAMRSGADAAAVTALIGTLGTDLLRADEFLAQGGSVGFAAFNSFVIILREGLEAVLLIAALLAYLSAIGAEAKHRRQIYAGVALGILGSIGTWFLANTLLPISGANRELLEGFTALAAVGVLLYVAHWLFQKTYIHDWKDYLRTRVGGAISRGSAFAMASLAFAAVYREGFETVLFYQALAFDAGVGAIMLGFIPGALLITAVGVAIIRAGVKLPLKKVFTWTNAVLMYLAFVFLGKGLYNLQEGGIFAAHPLPLPDHPALRQLFGFYPLLETVGAQLLFLIALYTTYRVYRGRMQPGANGPGATQTAKVVA